MLSKQDINVLTGIPTHSILNIYTYGSDVYGTSTAYSDKDFIIVVENGCAGVFDKAEFSNNIFNFTIYDVNEFCRLIFEHEISVLECLFLPDHLKQEHIKFEFVLDRAKLRKAVSEKCSNSFVKCKKKLTVEESFDPYVGKKSLWHSLRMAQFGFQIALTGQIFNYQTCNYLLQDIFSMSNDWEVIKEKYQPIYNRFMTEFRRVAPKENPNADK